MAEQRALHQQQLHMMLSFLESTLQLATTLLAKFTVPGYLLMVAGPVETIESSFQMHLAACEARVGKWWCRIAFIQCLGQPLQCMHDDCASGTANKVALALHLSFSRCHSSECHSESRALARRGLPQVTQAQSSTVPPKQRAAAPRHSATSRLRAVR